MALRKQYIDEKPLSGASIIGCLHMTIQTAVLIETLTVLGAKVRWSLCNIFHARPSCSCYRKKGIPVFAWKNETEKDFWWCIERTIEVKVKPKSNFR